MVVSRIGRVVGATRQHQYWPPMHRNPHVRLSPPMDHPVRTPLFPILLCKRANPEFHHKAAHWAGSMSEFTEPAPLEQILLDAIKFFPNLYFIFLPMGLKLIHRLLFLSTIQHFHVSLCIRRANLASCLSPRKSGLD